jgi:hypothetical protein
MEGGGMLDTFGWFIVGVVGFMACLIAAHGLVALGLWIHHHFRGSRWI